MGPTFNFIVNCNALVVGSDDRWQHLTIYHIERWPHISRMVQPPFLIRVNPAAAVVARSPMVPRKSSSGAFARCRSDS